MILILIAVAAIYYLLTSNSDYFDKRGVKYVKTTPILGIFADSLFGKKAFTEVFEDIYKKHPDRK